jgi:HPt (histidine-containing phosphotransfer) domain-containing protein
MTPVVDEASLAMLREVQEPGAPDIVEETVAIFLADSEQRLAVLEGAVAAGAAAEVRRVAHAIRGACLVLGVSRLADACGRLERMGAAGELRGAPDGLALVRSEYAAARDVLRAIAARRSA